MKIYSSDFGYVPVHAAYTVYNGGRLVQHPMVIQKPLKHSFEQAPGKRGFREGIGPHLVIADRLSMHGGDGLIVLYDHDKSVYKAVTNIQWVASDIQSDESMTLLINEVLEGESLFFESDF